MAACRNFHKREIKTMLSGFTGRNAARDKALFLLGITTGFRVSELCSLTIGDVIEKGVVRNRLKVMQKNTKGKYASRTVPILDHVRPYLVEALRDCNRRGFFRPEARLFRIGRKRAYTIIRTCADSQGVFDRVGTHSMRKSFAHFVYQDALEQRAHGIYLDPLLETSRALRHKTVQNTVAYLPESTELTYSLIRNLGRVFQ